MAQTIKIKRSTASSAPATIAAGELAYSKGSQTLYIGDPDTNNTNTPLAIGPAIINNAGTVSRATGVTATELQQIMDTEVGVDVQAYDADLTAIGGLAKTNGNFIVGNGTTWVAESGSTVRTSLGLGSLATLNSVGAAQIDANAVGASELNVTGNGTSGQVLASDGDGTMTWTSVAGTDVDVSVANLQTRLGQISSNVTIGDATDVTVTTSGDLEVTGDLTVSGTTTTVNSETLTVDDNIVVLNNNVTGTPTENAGIEVERGTSTNVLFQYNETNDRWEFTNDGSTFNNIPIPSEYAVGDITQVNITAGTGLSGTVNTTSGAHTQTLAVDLSELTDMTADVDSTQDELILLDNGADRRKLISEIPINAFRTSGNTDLEFEDAFIKLNSTSTVTSQNGGLYVERSGVSQNAVLFWDETDSKWKFGLEGLSNSVGIGDITQVQMTSTDGSVTFGGFASATGSVGDISFDVEVDTIDGGTY